MVTNMLQHHSTLSLQHAPEQLIVQSVICSVPTSAILLIRHLSSWCCYCRPLTRKRNGNSKANQILWQNKDTVQLHLEANKPPDELHCGLGAACVPDCVKYKLPLPN